MENKNQYEKPNLEHLDVVGKGQGGVCAIRDAEEQGISAWKDHS